MCCSQYTTRLFPLRFPAKESKTFEEDGDQGGGNLIGVRVSTNLAKIRMLPKIVVAGLTFLMLLELLDCADGLQGLSPIPPLPCQSWFLSVGAGRHRWSRREGLPASSMLPRHGRLRGSQADFVASHRLGTGLDPSLVDSLLEAAYSGAGRDGHCATEDEEVSINSVAGEL